MVAISSGIHQPKLKPRLWKTLTASVCLSTAPPRQLFSDCGATLAARLPEFNALQSLLCVRTGVEVKRARPIFLIFIWGSWWEQALIIYWSRWHSDEREHGECLGSRCCSASHQQCDLAESQPSRLQVHSMWRGSDNDLTPYMVGLLWGVINVLYDDWYIRRAQGNFAIFITIFQSIFFAYINL